ncbi:MAG: hypothetical protein R3245_03830 [Kiloniellales bacterium]|nr:hypothetical protein [Kiloniellales bacterium]
MPPLKDDVDANGSAARLSRLFQSFRQELLRDRPAPEIFEVLSAEPLWVRIFVVLNVFFFIAVLVMALAFERTFFALPALLVFAGGFTLLFGYRFSICLGSFLLALFYAVSYAKFSISGFGIVLSDLSLLGRNMLDLIAIDWRVQIFIFCLLVGVVCEGFFLLRIARVSRQNILPALVILGLALAAFPYSRSVIAEARASELQHQLKWMVAAAPSLASFLASIEVPALELRTEPRADWADSIDLGAGPQHAAFQEDRKVNLFLLLYESTFDPSYLDGADFPIEPSELLRPETGKSGPLLVPVYGGGTWLTEFALLMGQSPHAYGANAFNLNNLLEGRLKSSVLDGLREARFALNVIYPVGGYFLNARGFYEGLGMDFHEPNEEGFSTQDIFRDDLLFHRALKLLDPEGSNLQIIVTMQNHGPHNLSDPFKDYWRRLKKQETEASLFKDTIAEAFHEYENYFLSFGDHHPLFTQSLGLSKEARHTTFWSLDCRGTCQAFNHMSFPEEPIGVEFLLGSFLNQADLPRGRIEAAHRELLARDCLSLDFQCRELDRHALNWVFSRIGVGDPD